MAYVTDMKESHLSSKGDFAGGRQNALFIREGNGKNVLHKGAVVKGKL